MIFVDGREAFKKVLEYVHENGDVRSPRGLKTYDVGYTTIELVTAYDALALGVGRKLSKRVAAAEAIQLIGGFADPQLLLQASPNFVRYIEPSGEFWGAYGRRIAYGRQLWSVVRKLEQDPDTRQAVITLWDPAQDNELGHKDYPCTLALGFSIQRGKLELDVTMRSNDVWRGLPYDLFQFTQLQLTVANVLDLQPGRYRHHTYSLHLYAEDADEAMNVYLGNSDASPGFLPTGFGNQVNFSTIDQAMARARMIAKETIMENLDESERWYWNALHPAE
jgi:thymidylate synthase